MNSPNDLSFATRLTCTQCGGELHPDEGQIFATCPFCSTTVYLDRSRVVFHWYVAPTLDEQKAAAALYRWMSGSQTVKDLDKKARVVGQSFQYFPIWHFKRDTPRGEEITLQPAAATSVTELARLHLPAGDLRKYDADLDAQAAAPSVPLEAALTWAGDRADAEAAPKALAAGQTPLPGQIGSRAGRIKEASLVHVPLYFFKYSFRGGDYTAVVDAASGTVMANLFPAKDEVPYRLVGGVTALVFLVLAFIPLVLGFGFNEMGAGTGMLVCGAAGLVVGPILFAWAFWVASKV